MLFLKPRPTYPNVIAHCKPIQCTSARRSSDTYYVGKSIIYVPLYSADHTSLRNGPAKDVHRSYGN